MTDHARPLELFRFDDEVQRVSVRMEGGPPSGMGDDRYLSGRRRPVFCSRILVVPFAWPSGMNGRSSPVSGEHM
ncbi:hypothetical protein ACIF70_17345 [Actinacidiphila glaucinigra]|uniref:hypothetical protein n=1 Tax=Actinacidiphila glaucinigra TaxID=235986 RepID=UPI002DDBB921|nr:hypothetical protein [Actinacidiphila glaucinigra]WSD58136.1 hypothetical protein OIE69_04120 [Actinacidiphila glaucinigra]